MAGPCDQLKNAAASVAGAAEMVVAELKGLGPIDTPEKKDKADALKQQYRSLRGVYDAIKSLYTRDPALGGCGGDASDLEPFPTQQTVGEI